MAEPTDIKQAAAQGLFERIKTLDYSQLLSVILLSLIAVGIYWGVGEIKSYGTAQESAHREERKERDERFSGALKSVTESYRDDGRQSRATFERTLDRIQGKIPKAEAAAMEKPEPGPPGTD